MIEEQFTVDEEIANIKAKYITNVEVSVAEIISYIKYRVDAIGKTNESEDEKRRRLDEFFFLISFIENGEW